MPKPREGAQLANSEPLTCSIVEGGKMAGIGKAASYVAARNGTMPTIRVGNMDRVPIKKWRQILNGEATAKNGTPAAQGDGCGM
jgi:hypothetical protein